MHLVPVSERVSILYVDRGIIEQDGHTVVVHQGDTTTVLPVGRTASILIGPGVSISHAAVKLCAAENALLIWVGEHGVRLYAAGEPRGQADQIIRQAVLFSNPVTRIAVARKLYGWMFGEAAPMNRSIEQLRGIEGFKVKKWYSEIALANGLVWESRQMDMKDPINAAISGANAALYGVAEAVILSLGYSPAIGYVHTGNSRSFVYDLSDIKFKTVVPLAFRIAKESNDNIEHRIRIACRDAFFEQKIIYQLVNILEDGFARSNLIRWELVVERVASCRAVRHQRHRRPAILRDDTNFPNRRIFG